MSWTKTEAVTAVLNFDNLSEPQQNEICQLLDKEYSYSQYVEMKSKKLKALENSKKTRDLLLQSKQHFPIVNAHSTVEIDTNALRGYAIVITAGGEGERLKQSLMAKGYNSKELKDFTKATFPIPQTPFKHGALEINLSVICSLEKQYNTTIPVIVTTGPHNSDTGRVIPKILQENNNFGLSMLKVVAQEERLHLSENNQIVPLFENDKVVGFASNPDETGGPIVKITQELTSWLGNAGVMNLLILQGTAIYEPSLIPLMATEGKKYDVLGVGIARQEFPTRDPYGTFVLCEFNQQKKLLIAEKDVRTHDTMELYDTINRQYLPFNTGFYAVTLAALQSNKLPDYASPKKEILPSLPPAEKIGYAATDLLGFSEHCGVVTINETDYAVIKTADDLLTLSETVRRFRLEQYKQ